MNNVVACGNEDSIKGFAERAVIIVDQETKGVSFIGQTPNQLACFLSDPDLMGVGCDAGKMDAARTQFDEEEHIDGLKPDGFYCEHIASEDLVFVVVHQMTPTNGTITNWCWLDAIAFENVTNVWLRCVEAQLDEFTMDLAIAPARVLTSKPKN